MFEKSILSSASVPRICMVTSSGRVPSVTESVPEARAPLTSARIPCTSSPASRFTARSESTSPTRSRRREAG